MEKSYFLLFILCFGTGFYLKGQQTCFDLYLEQGDTALLSQNFDVALQSFQDVLDCDDLEKWQKDTAGARLDRAIFQKIEKEKIEKELAIKNRNIAEARRLAFLANLEQDDKRIKLELAYYAKRILRDTQLLAVEEAFDNAVLDSFLLRKSEVSAAQFLSGQHLQISRSTLDGFAAITPFTDNAFFESTTSGGLVLQTLEKAHIQTFKERNTPVHLVSVSPDTSFIITSSKNGTTYWRSTSWKDEQLLNEQNAIVYQVGFAPDNQTFFTRSATDTLHLWTNRGEFLAHLIHNGLIQDAAFVGDKIVTVSSDGTVKFWHGKTGVKIKTVEEHNAPIHRLDVSPDGLQFVTFDAQRKGFLWNKDGEVLEQLATFPNLVSVQFGHDKDQLLYRCETEFYMVSKDTIISFAGHDKYINGIVYSPNGKNLLSWSQDSTAKVWDMSGEVLLVLDQFLGEVKVGQFSPDSKKVMGYDTEGYLVSCAIPTYIFDGLLAHNFELRPTTIDSFKIQEMDFSIPPTYVKAESIPSSVLEEKEPDQLAQPQVDTFSEGKIKEQRLIETKTVIIQETLNLTEAQENDLEPIVTWQIIEETGLYKAPSTGRFKHLKLGTKLVDLGQETTYWRAVKYGDKEGWVKKHKIE